MSMEDLILVLEQYFWTFGLDLDNLHFVFKQ